MEEVEYSFQMHTPNEPEFFDAIRKLGDALELSECFFAKKLCIYYEVLKYVLQQTPTNSQDLFAVLMCKYAYLHIVHMVQKTSKASSERQIPIIFECTKTINELLEIKPDCAFLYYRKAVLAHAIRRSSQALIADLKSILERFPLYFNAHYLLAVIHYNRNDKEKAEKYCKNFIQIAPEESLHSSFVYYLYSKILLESALEGDIATCVIEKHSQLKEAETIFKKAVNAQKYWSTITDKSPRGWTLEKWNQLGEVGYKFDDDFEIPDEEEPSQEDQVIEGWKMLHFILFAALVLGLYKLGYL
jgi:tetratricopeptide (TPR) repeat protein